MHNNSDNMENAHSRLYVLKFIKCHGNISGQASGNFRVSGEKPN